MGGLYRYMPITWITAIIGSLALAGVPPFAGFFSKDAIIEAVHLSTIPGHGYAYFAVMCGVFITAFYSFRMLFLAFHGNERFGAAGHAAAEASEEGAHDASSSAGAEPDAHGQASGPPKESPWVITVPLILLAIPSVYSGWAYIEPMLFGDYFGTSIVVAEKHAVLKELAAEWHGAGDFIRHGLASAPFWIAIAGLPPAGDCYIVHPRLP